MAVLHRAEGAPDPYTARLIERLFEYARQPADDDLETNLDRVRSLHHVLDAAGDAMKVGMAVVNADGPGKASLRAMGSEFKFETLTVKKYVDQGKALLNEAA